MKSLRDKINVIYLDIFPCYMTLFQYLVQWRTYSLFRQTVAQGSYMSVFWCLPHLHMKLNNQSNCSKQCSHRQLVKRNKNIVNLNWNWWLIFGLSILFSYVSSMNMRSLHFTVPGYNLWLQKKKTKTVKFVAHTRAFLCITESWLGLFTIFASSRLYTHSTRFRAFRPLCIFRFVSWF